MTDPIQELESLQYTLQLRWFKEDMKYILARNYWHYLPGEVEKHWLLFGKTGRQIITRIQWRIAD